MFADGVVTPQIMQPSQRSVLENVIVILRMSSVAYDIVVFRECQDRIEGSFFFVFCSVENGDNMKLKIIRII